jgi:hypothetical protein
MKFPRHACGLYLTHNEHRDYYQTAAEWFTERATIEVIPQFASPDARQRCIDTDEVWTLQWYPNTPIGSYYIAAPTLEELLAFAAEVEGRDGG